MGYFFVTGVLENDTIRKFWKVVTGISGKKNPGLVSTLWANCHLVSTFAARYKVNENACPDESVKSFSYR